MTEKSKFIHLRLHSEYSLLEGAVKIKSLPALCAKMNMPAVAVTDTNNLFAALEFSVGASGAGVQPIIGCQMDLQYKKLDPSGKTNSSAPLVLLAQSESGYANLMKLNSCLYIDTKGQLPQITVNDLHTYSSDIICLTGGANGPVGKLIQTLQIPAAKTLMTKLSKIFTNRLYVELQRHPTASGLPNAEQMTESDFLNMAYEMDLPLVATNDVY
ncbi:MAG: DNA polymerase III subunit alpha, partial [Aestuariivita sp.]|nr:DNA polymerase III subunit alpha [Aestuariivita sp.]